MSEDEVNAAFESVLNDAAATDHEQFVTFADAMTERMEALLDDGSVPVKIMDIDGQKFIAVPEPIMASFIAALHEYCEFNQDVAHQISLGNAALLIAPLMTGAQVQSLAVKCAFVSLALAKDAEQEIVQYLIGEIEGNA